MDSLDVAVDDLPAAPAVPGGERREVARLLESLLGNLHGVEAQVTSLGRELCSSSPRPERAVQLTMASLVAIRTTISAFALAADKIRGR